MIHVTRGPNRRTLDTRTSADGRDRVTFDTGTGDYLVYASAPGKRGARLRVQRGSSSAGLEANFVLGPAVRTRSAVRVVAKSTLRATNPPPRPEQPEIGAIERWTEGVTGQLPPDLVGDLAAMLGTQASVVVTSAGASVLGAPPTSNLTTVNGAEAGVRTLPALLGRLENT